MSSEEYCVRVVDLPCTVKALLRFDAEGFPNIYVNARLSQEEQKKAIAHELRHIRRDDAYSAEEIEKMERMADCENANDIVDD